MATSDNSCTDCVYDQFPAQYSQSRKIAAAVIGSVDIIILYGGLLFVWLRRHEPLISRRDWTLSIGLALTNLLWLIVQYRELFNESHLPCPAYYFVSTFNTSVMPALVAARWIGLFARHVRQARIAAQHAHVASGDILPRPDVAAPSTASAAGDSPAEPTRTRWSLADAALAAEADASFRNDRPHTQTTDDSISNYERLHSVGASPAAVATSHPLLEKVDRLVLRLRLDSIGPQLVLVFILSLPHFIFYFVRLGMPGSYPDYSDPKHVGCMFDDTENGFFVLAPLLLLAVVVPILFRLRRAQDALGLRTELLVQLVALPPCFVFWIVGEYMEFETTLHVNQEYGITVWLDIISISSMWVPAILSFSNASQNAPAPGSSTAPVRRWLPWQRLATVAPCPDPLEAVCSDEDTSEETQEQRTEDTPRLGGDVSRNGDSDAMSGGGSGAAAGPAAAGVGSTPASATGAWAEKLAVRIARHAVVSPAPAAREILSALSLSSNRALSDGRALSVVTSVLMFARVGSAALRRILEREFCLETLSFAIDAYSVRVVCARAEARLSRSPQDQARADGAVSANVTPVRRPSKRLAASASALMTPAPPEASQVTADAATPVAQTVTLAAVPLSAATVVPMTTVTAAQTDLTVLRPLPPQIVRGSSLRSRGKRAAEPPLDAPRLRLRALIRHYVSPDADMLVNLSARQSAALVSAAAALDVAASAAQPLVDDALSALRSAQTVLQAAELEIFNLIKRGPVFRFVQSGDYTRWVTAALASLESM